jgi:hypothetical protein
MRHIPRHRTKPGTHSESLSENLLRRIKSEKAEDKARGAAVSEKIRRCSATLYAAFAAARLQEEVFG